MGFQLSEAYVELTTRGESSLDSSLARVRHRAEQTEQRFKRLRDMSRRFFHGLSYGVEFGAGFTIFRKLEEAIGGMIRLTGENDESQARLKAALRATGQEVERNFAAMENLNEAMERQVNLRMEDARDLEAFATNLGVGAGQLANFTKASVGLARVMGVDAKTAADDLAKALGGNWMMLQRSLPAIRMAVTEQQRLAVAQKLASEGLEEDAELSHTLSGSVKQAQLAWQHLALVLAEDVAPVVTNVADRLTFMARVLDHGGAARSLFLDRVVRDLMHVEIWADKADLAALRLRDTMMGGGKRADTLGMEKLLDQNQERLKKVEADIAAQSKKYIQNQLNDENQLNLARLQHLDGYREKMQGVFSSVQDIWFTIARKTLEAGTMLGQALTGGLPGDAAGAAPRGAAGAGGGAHPGGASNAIRQLHDRQWHIRRLARDRDEYGQLQDMGVGGSGDANWAARYHRMRQLEKEMAEDSDIEEFGSTARARGERRKFENNQGLASRVEKMRADRTRMAREYLNRLQHGPHYSNPELEKHRAQIIDRARHELAYQEQQADAQARSMTRENRRNNRIIDRREGINDARERGAMNHPVTVTLSPNDMLYRVLLKLDAALPTLGGFP